MQAAEQLGGLRVGEGEGRQQVGRPAERMDPQGDPREWMVSWGCGAAQRPASGERGEAAGRLDEAGGGLIAGGESKGRGGRQVG